MQIVIDIPKYVYDTIVASDGYIADCDNEKVGMAVKNGTPLPTPHGDLIDRDMVRKKYQEMATYAYTVNIKAKMETVINACIDQLEYAQTVIENEE